MIRQAMILSAGKGTRLRPLTLTTPKPLVSVGGQPLIAWHLRALKQAGVTDVAINVSWLADALLSALGDGQDFGIQIHWSIEPDEPLETAGGIRQALATGKLADEPFLLINGDVWTPLDFSQLLQHDLQDNLAHLLLTDQATHNPNGDFALQDGRVLAEGAPKHTFAGISVLAPRLLASVPIGATQSLAPLLRTAMQDGKVTGELLTQDWVDVGTLARLEHLNAKIAAQGVAGHLGAPA
ncbi:N-acetylmuramate alpha-1-phosphate uridylyltransferase MurU [Moraxella atlantae]|uniref:N-acetylmuramate alpha-1-phosphate uridylyltransferase MurU n=1 Tax=Faucicola atlantae TaxID=34059 RepID=UPI00375261B9